MTFFGCCRDCIASKGRMNVNDELVGKEVLRSVACFKITVPVVDGRTEENH
jgi:hypothetical protein